VLFGFRTKQQIKIVQLSVLETEELEVRCAFTPFAKQNYLKNLSLDGVNKLTHFYEAT